MDTHAHHKDCCAILARIDQMSLVLSIINESKIKKMGQVQVRSSLKLNDLDLCYTLNLIWHPPTSKLFLVLNIF